MMVMPLGEWNIKDHLIQDFDVLKNNFGVIADNPGNLNVNFLNGWPVDTIGYILIPFQYDEEFDQIVISPRRMSEIGLLIKVFQQQKLRGTAGDFLYRWGNPQVYNQGMRQTENYMDNILHTIYLL